MPLYEYECDECHHRFEVIQKFSDPPVAVCPQCAGGVRKLLSSPAIQFKGTGWYITDYARKGNGSAKDGAGAKGEGNSKADGGANADTGSKSDGATSASSPSSSSSSSKTA